MRSWSRTDKVTPVNVTLSGADGTSSVVTVDPLVVSILPQQLGFRDRSLDGGELAAGLSSGIDH
jgi:hypothetical protein